MVMRHMLKFQLTDPSSDRNTMQGSMTSSTIYIPADYYWFSQLPEEAGWGTTKSVEFEAGRPYNRG